MRNRKLDISRLNELAQVWYCTFSKNEPLLPSFKNLLSADEVNRASRFKFQKDRNSFIITRGVLRTLLGSYLEITPSEIRLEYTSYGKPYLFDSALKFNVSHSGDMAVFAFVLDTEVGVDIERVKNDFDVMELARNFFSKEEIAAMEKIPEAQLTRAFYRCWTRKESFIKAEGSGLSFPLDKFAVSLDHDHQASLIQTQWDFKEKENWSLYSFLPQQEYIGALAIRDNLKGIEYKNWDEIKRTS